METSLPLLKFYFVVIAGVGVITCSVCAIISLSGDQVVEIGNDVTLTCEVSHGHLPVSWLKLPNASLPEGGGGDRVFVSRGVRAPHVSILRVLNVSWTDAGTYECSQNVEGQRVSLSATVYVTCQYDSTNGGAQFPQRRAAKTTNLLFSGQGALGNHHRDPFIVGRDQHRLAVTRGSHVQFWCDVSEEAVERRVFWRRATRPLLHMAFPSRVLTICSVHHRDGGEYTCEADEGGGLWASKEVLLDVQYAPSVVVAQPRVEQALSYSAELQCVVDSWPQARLRWYREDEELDPEATDSPATSVNSSSFVISVQNAGPSEATRLVTTLTVTAISEADFGNYTCRADNSLGQASATLSLQESLVPVLPSQASSSQGDEALTPAPPLATFNVTGFILGMMPPLCISFYIILHLGFRSRYAGERPEEEGGDGVDEMAWEQSVKVA